MFKQSSSPNTQEKMRHWIGWVFFHDLIRALGLTFSYLFSKTVTMQYPDKEKWKPYPRFRGHHFLRKDEAGNNKCVACELCAKICPSKCITVIPYEDDEGNRHPQVFDIDLGRCLYCGLCEDACPVDAIAMGSIYEFACYSSKELLVGKETLLNMPGKNEEGGVVVQAQFKAGEKLGEKPVVEAKGSKGYHWWKYIRRSKDLPLR
jgi:NADH-quinone oxidoreductase subunit I